MKKYFSKIYKGIWLLTVLILFCTNTATAFAQEETQIQQAYGIGSVSKMFATAAVMRLVDMGQVGLDTPVTEYIPEFEMADERYRQITVRMLLNHSSGIMGTTYESCFVMGNSEEEYQEILLKALKEQELKADPGEYGVYCNDGFTLAEIVVERVSGMSFEEFVEKEFAGPLGMKHTFMPSAITEKSELAPVYYGIRQLPWQNVQSLASGGIYSTPEDLCRFSRVYMEDGAGILSEESVAAMAFPEYKNNKICRYEGNSSFHYGLGWDSVDAYADYGVTALLKGGDTGSYGAGLTVLPEQNLSVAVTVSGGSSEYCQIMAQTIIMEVLEENGLIDETRKEAAKTTLPSMEEAQEIPEEMKKYEGTYASAHIWKAEFAENNRLILTSLENGSDMVQEYFYTKDGSFVSTKGKYISHAGLTQTTGGISGITEFRFSEESNGKIYMTGTTYMTSSNEGETVITMPFAEKIEENKLSEAADKAWEARDGKEYYMVSECYNSSYYLTIPSMKAERISTFGGYTQATEEAQNCRIIDENSAVCELDLPVMIGRDLRNYHFRQEGETEYMQYGGHTFIEESAMEGSGSLNNDISVGKMGKWYYVEKSDAGREIRIEAPAGGAYYVYDKNNNCVAGSLLVGELPTVILPEDGKVLLVGGQKKGSCFTVVR